MEHVTKHTRSALGSGPLGQGTYPGDSINSTCNIQKGRARKTHWAVLLWASESWKEIVPLLNSNTTPFWKLIHLWAVQYFPLFPSFPLFFFSQSSNIPFHLVCQMILYKNPDWVFLTIYRRQLCHFGHQGNWSLVLSYVTCKKTCRNVYSHVYPTLAPSHQRGLSE